MITEFSVTRAKVTTSCGFYLYAVCQSRYYSLGHKFILYNIRWT